MMENYTKARTVEQLSVCPFSGIPSDTPEVRVKDGSKIRNLLRYALSRMEVKQRAAEDEGRPASEDGGVAAEGQQEAAARPLCKQIVFTASGKGVSKAITCVEIVKRRVKGLHQLTRLLFSTVDEVWEPLEPVGLDSLTVSRNQPTIWILLSREPLDSSQSGYQAPGRYDALWAQSNKGDSGGLAGPKAGHKRKKGGGRGRGFEPGRQTGRSREAAKGQS